jgi:hypothetical protein
MQVISLFHLAESSPFCNWYYLFTLLFLSKQTRHGRNIVSLYFFLLVCGGAECLSPEQCVTASCSLPKYFERWPTTLYEARRSVLMLMKGSKIPRFELSAVHLYQHYSLFVPNKLHKTIRGDYCECAACPTARLNWSSRSVPPGTLSTIRSPPGPHMIQQFRWVVV